MWWWLIDCLGDESEDLLGAEISELPAVYYFMMAVVVYHER